MLLSNLTSHPSLITPIANLKIPLVPLPSSKTYPPWFLPASASSSSSIHPDYRSPDVSPPNKEAGQEDERDIEGLRALVQAFEDGAGEGVRDSTGKRKGECHFLASVFANVSMVRPPHPDFSFRPTKYVWTEFTLTTEKIPATRQLLLIPQPPFPAATSSKPSETDEPLLTKIVVYTEHPDTIRRGGALGCIKNCAMDRASMGWLLASEGRSCRS